jgi:hypothetical protein
MKKMKQFRKGIFYYNESAFSGCIGKFPHQVEMVDTYVGKFPHQVEKVDTYVGKFPHQVGKVDTYVRKFPHRVGKVDTCVFSGNVIIHHCFFIIEITG